MTFNENSEPDSNKESKNASRFPADQKEQTEHLLQMAGLKPSDFYEKFDVVDSLIRGVLARIDIGFHILRISFSGEDALIIAKKDPLEAMVSSNVSSFATHFTIGMMMDAIFIMELRSYFNEGQSEPSSLTHDVAQEIRGWFVLGSNVVPMTSQQIIEKHCTNFETGKFLEPERNLAFRDGWGIGETPHPES